MVKTGKMSRTASKLGGDLPPHETIQTIRQGSSKFDALVPSVRESRTQLNGASTMVVSQTLLVAPSRSSLLDDTHSTNTSRPCDSIHRASNSLTPALPWMMNMTKTQALATLAMTYSERVPSIHIATVTLKTTLSIHEVQIANRMSVVPATIGVSILNAIRLVFRAGRGSLICSPQPGRRFKLTG